MALKMLPDTPTAAKYYRLKVTALTGKPKSGSSVVLYARGQKKLTKTEVEEIIRKRLKGLRL